VATTETITVSEFKAKCLKILDRLARRELERVIITKSGRTVGVLLPPQTLAVQDVFGSMRGSVTIPEGFDLTAPALNGPLDAEEGIWHRE
jgi:prevent-host-death family protein